MAFGITTLSIITLSIPTFKTTRLIITAFGIMTLGIITLII